MTRILAKAVLQAADGSVLLLKRSKTDSRRPLEWDVPGGQVEDGEDYHVACTREIEEESGFVVSPTDLQLAYCTSAIIPEVGNVCWLFFTASVEKREPKLSFEHEDATWVSFDEALKLIEYPLQKQALAHIEQALEA